MIRRKIPDQDGVRALRHKLNNKFIYKRGKQHDQEAQSGRGSARSNSSSILCSREAHLLYVVVSFDEWPDGWCEFITVRCRLLVRMVVEGRTRSFRDSGILMEDGLLELFKFSRGYV
mmetsp:Transcript_18207/g.23048  ORF Transcript_18207/g.23048 Transcript_18207/m.23048 type:complete len:117 (+) Transcript_18207:591-941(+)